MTLQRFAELDALAADMAQRHRTHGPPTLEYFALGLQRYAAQYQGRHADAAPELAHARGRRLTAHEALTVMRDVLAERTAESQTTG